MREGFRLVPSLIQFHVDVIYFMQKVKYVKGVTDLVNGESGQITEEAEYS